MKRSALLLLLWFSVDVTRAQTEILALAPLQIGVEGWYASEPGDLGFVAKGQRTVPLYFFLPNVSEDSRFDFGTLALGGRSVRRVQSIAFSIQVMDAFVAKSPWAGGVTLLRYDRTGALRLDADWLALRFGPVLRWGGLEARVLARAAFSTVGHTGALFLGPDESSTGLKGSGQGEAIFRPSLNVKFVARAGIHALAAGTNPVWRSWSAGVTLNPEGILSPRVSLGQIDLQADNYRRSSEWLVRFGLVLTPKRRDF